jgi:cytochrome c553
MKKIVSLAMIVGLSSFAFADGAAQYKRCAGCHGVNGEKPAMGNKSKIIKDMTKQEIVDSLQGYKNGTYGGAMKGLMAGQVKSLDKSAIEAIANHIGK